MDVFDRCFAFSNERKNTNRDKTDERSHCHIMVIHNIS